MAQMATDTQRIMGQVTAMAMLDADFRARLEAAPIDVLREFGMDVPGMTRVEVVSDAAALHADGDTVQLFVPDAAELSEEELSMVAGAVASCNGTASTGCSFFTVSCLSTASTESCS